MQYYPSGLPWAERLSDSFTAQPKMSVMRWDCNYGKKTCDSWKVFRMMWLYLYNNLRAHRSWKQNIALE